MLGLFFGAIWKVLLVGVIVGAGLPALFSAGIRAMAVGTGGDAEVNHDGPHPVGRIVAYAIFAVVVLCILEAISYVVATGMGYKVDFGHVIPAFHK